MTARSVVWRFRRKLRVSTRKHPGQVLLASTGVLVVILVISSVLGVIGMAVLTSDREAGQEVATESGERAGANGPANGPANDTANDTAGAPAQYRAAPETSVADDSGGADTGMLSQPDRAVVRTAGLTVAVTDLPGASARVRALVGAVGGFVASEHAVNRDPADRQRRGEDGRSGPKPEQADRQVTMTLRVPADRLDTVMDQLATTGRVTERSQQATDVTEQVADLEGRLASQEASVTRIRALLERANAVGEVVMIESELAKREATVESLRKRLAALSNRVAMSTLTVRLVADPVADDASGRPSGAGFTAGLAAGWRALLSVAGGVLTAFGAGLPFLAVFGLLAGLGLFIRRAFRRITRSRAPKSAGQNEQRDRASDS